MNTSSSRTSSLKHLSILWVVAIIVPLYEISYHNYIESQVPESADWEKASQIIEKMYKPDDLVIISPWWATNGWIYLGKFMNIEKMARDDDTGYGRIWEVAWKKRSRKDLKQNGKLSGVWKTKNLIVKLWSFPKAPETIYDFVKKIENASVEMISMQKVVERKCIFKSTRFHSGKFICDPSLPWNTVHKEIIADLENKPRLCIWAHPINNKIVRISFNNVPPANFIEGYTGLKYEADREGAGKPPVYLDIYLSGKFLASTAHEEGGGWTSYKYKIPEWWNGGQVTFEVHTSFDGMQHFCFTSKLRNK